MRVMRRLQSFRGEGVSGRRRTWRRCRSIATAYKKWLDCEARRSLNEAPGYSRRVRSDPRERDSIEPIAHSRAESQVGTRGGAWDWECVASAVTRSGRQASKSTHHDA
eukprot:5945930-Prymnesium_polylepis.2